MIIAPEVDINGRYYCVNVQQLPSRCDIEVYRDECLQKLSLMRTDTWAFISKEGHVIPEDRLNQLPSCLNRSGDVVKCIADIPWYVRIMRWIGVSWYW